VVSAVSDLSARASAEERLWRTLGEVMDPEIPVLSVVDLGIVRHARVDERGCAHVGLTPTYSGCPATEVIRADVGSALKAAGYERPVITEVLSPPWTSDWISERGRRRLQEYGIAPPAERVSNPRHLLRPAPVIECPRCASRDTEKLSEFGSTPCKALYRCTRCLEPFDYFKCI
jgi:ring-1,2-phenylacetyl-CoA epoxidase subunit PaaD